MIQSRMMPLPVRSERDMGLLPKLQGAGLWSGIAKLLLIPLLCAILHLHNHQPSDRTFRVTKGWHLIAGSGLWSSMHAER